MAAPRLRLDRRDVLAGGVAVAVAIVTLLLAGSGVLANLERQTVDERFTWRGVRTPGNGIVIVGIDQKTLQSLGTRLPLPRSLYAEVLDRIDAASPSVIAVDTQFIGRSDPAEDRALLDAVARNGPILLATHDGPDGLITVPADVAGAPGAVPVSSAIEKDPDGVLRRMIYAPVHTTTLAVRAAESITGRPVDQSRFPDNHAWIDFRGPPGTFVKYSFDDVLAGRVPTDAFAGRAVLIGITDPVEDVFVTSVSPVPMPGVEVHANALWTVWAGVPLREAATATDVAVVLALIALVAIVGARRSALWILAGAVGVLVVFVASAQLAFDAGWIVNVVYPIVGLVLSAAAMIGVDAYEVRRQRARLERDLGVLAAPLRPPSFFVSYRRQYNATHAQAITRELTRRYGDGCVFMDTASIEFGDDFPDRIVGALRVCGAVLVVIGPEWLTTVDGHRRIDDPDDWVRREVETALQRGDDAAVIPVLVDGAKPLDVADLPESIQGLALKHALAIHGELSANIDQLVASFDRARRRLAHRHRAERRGETRDQEPSPSG